MYNMKNTKYLFDKYFIIIVLYNNTILDVLSFIFCFFFIILKKKITIFKFCYILFRYKYIKNSLKKMKSRLILRYMYYLKERNYRN